MWCAHEKWMPANSKCNNSLCYKSVVQTLYGVTHSTCACDQLMNPANFMLLLLTGHPWSHRFPSWRRLPRWQKRQGGAAPGSVPEASTTQTSGRRCSAPPGGTGKGGDKMTCHSAALRKWMNLNMRNMRKCSNNDNAESIYSSYATSGKGRAQNDVKLK